MTLISDIDLPDYLTAPAAYHGVLPSDAGTSALARLARDQVSRALAVLNSNGVQLAEFTKTQHCVKEGAHLSFRTSTRHNHVDVVLQLDLTHFDSHLNPPTHPGYAALRAARVAEVDRWAGLFRAQGWGVQAVDDATPNRLGLVLSPPPPALPTN